MNKLELINVKKNYTNSVETLEILREIDLVVEQGDLISIQGKSGSGKTTFLNIIGLLDIPTEGIIKYNNEIIEMKKDIQMTKYRSELIGFVFQFHYLLTEFTALENVMLPALASSKNKKEIEERAKELLDSVGLADRMNHNPLQLSGGEKQRVAIARSMINNPKIILADEPTGNLDLETSEKIHEIFKKINKEKNQTIVLVTHSNELANISKNKYKLERGKLIDLTNFDIKI